MKVDRLPAIILAVLCICMVGCGPKITYNITSGESEASAQEEAYVSDEAEADMTDPSAEKSEEDSRPDTGASGPNLIAGGDFTEKDGNWGIYQESGGSASFDISAGRLVLKIADPGRVGHAVQLYCEGFELLSGGKYLFTADLSSSVPRTFEWRIQLNGGDYHPYVDIPDATAGPDMSELRCEFEMTEASDPSPRLCFNLGDADKAQGLGAHEIYLDNVKLILTDDTQAKKVETMGELSPVNINQIGYRPNDDKRAVFREYSGGTFDVVEVSSGKSVYSGQITEGNRFGTSGDTVGYGDFSSVAAPGTYKITSPAGDSYEFDIRDGIYDDALKDSVRMLTLQRCGMELAKDIAGDFAHGACHIEDARIYGGDGTLDVTGGWHDAGDYGRYTVPGAKAAADLMLAYELFPDAFSDELNIPESGNGVPDILNEARYELEWLLKMQAADGGAYHKVTGLNFDGFVAADECSEELYVLPVSKTATADLAAVMFMASRVYKEIDPAFSDRCREAAERAISAYTAIIDERNYTNPKDVLTGEYGDGNSADEFLWVVCEAYKTTLDKKYEKMLEMVEYPRIKNDGLGWSDMSGYAYYAYLSADERMESPFDIEGRFHELCEKLKDDALNREAYGCTLTDDFPWGSNMLVANNGMALLMADSLSPDPEYVLAAKRQLDYLLGTNSNSYCFLTGYGTQTPSDPHHRPSRAVGKCMKGMLVGGPDSYLDDPYAKSVLKGLPKARCYTDNYQSYSCNEICIYWNSPLCVLIAGLK